MRGKTRAQKVLLAVVAGVVGAFAVGTPALAYVITQYPPEGGTWEYGIDESNVNFSYYNHPSQNHRSSVSNPLKGLVRSICDSGGRWTYATEAASTSGNQAFYNPSC
jgi:lactococcin 972 family bacteriocin